MTGATEPALLPFSVLLPVYAGDRADFLDRAFRSVTEDQSLPPDEVVIVQDGPVGADLRDVLDKLTSTSAQPVRRVVLETNVGLARALEAGLDACTHEIVARMDADDVALPQRFERQVPLMHSLDIVGSAIQEFASESEPGVVRTPPLSGHEIDRSSRLYSPFNHPSVVFRRSVVRAAGGYQDLPLLEDYWLWVRMITAGVRAGNLPEVLLLYRVGAGAYGRRGGALVLRSEIELQRRMHRIGFTSKGQLVRNVLVRGGYRLVPESLRRRAYRKVVVGM